MDKCLVIGIAGPSAGGKTTVTQKLSEIFNDEVIIIKYDDYYKDQSELSFEERCKVNYDHPNAFDTELLIKQLSMLIKGNSIEKPIYDYTIHTRSDVTEVIEPRRIIILEGLFALLEERIRDLLDIKIFVETDPDVCFIRRLKRDTRDRGRTQESVIEQYLNTVKPMQEVFINPTRKFADVVVLHGGKNPVVIDMIKNLINGKLA